MLASGAFKRDFGHPLLSHLERLDPMQVARAAQSSASCSSDLMPVKPFVMSPPRKSVFSQTPNWNWFRVVTMTLDGVLPPAHTVGNGTLLDVLDELEDVALEEERLDELDVVAIDDVLERVDEAELEDVLETVDDMEIEEEVLEGTVVVPLDTVSKSLKTASTPEFETAGLRTLFGQPPLIRFSREAPTHPARLEQSSASCSTDVMPPMGPVTESPDLKSVFKQTPNRAPLLVVTTLDGPALEAHIFVFCGGGAGVTGLGIL